MDKDNFLIKTWKEDKDIFFEDIIFEDDDGEIRYDINRENYEYYPEWLGNSQSETEFWETR